MEPSPGRSFGRLWRGFPAGVIVVTTRLPDGSVHGLTTERFMMVAREPPMASFLLAKRQRTYDNIHREGRFGINVLETRQVAWADYFSRWPRPPQPGALRTTPSGAIAIEGALAFLDCALALQVEVGHGAMLVVGEALGVEVGEGFPLMFMGGEYLSVAGGPGP